MQRRLLASQVQKLTDELTATRAELTGLSERHAAHVQASEATESELRAQLAQLRSDTDSERSTLTARAAHLEGQNNLLRKRQSTRSRIVLG